MRSLFIILAISLFNVFAYAQCLQEGEAVAIQEKFEGADYIKIKVCAFNWETKKIEPLLGLTRTQVNQFLDRSAKLPNNSSLWGSLKTMGFQDRADLDKKLDAYFANQEVRLVSFSAELFNKDGSEVNPATIKARKNASEHVAELYNMMFSKESLLPELNGFQGGKDNRSKNRP